jgi:hypothetical protein
MEITFKYYALDWYMGLTINIPQEVPIIVADVKKELVNEFQRPSLEDHIMNEMIEIK